jgi:hypothetical protein
VTATHVKIKIKFMFSENYRLAFCGDLVPFQSFKLNMRKGSCLLSRYEELAKSVTPSEMTKEGDSIHGEL